MYNFNKGRKSTNANVPQDNFIKIFKNFMPKTPLPKIDWESHKQAVLDNLKWDERIVRFIIDNHFYEVEQDIAGSEVITRINIQPCEITLSDTFMG